MPKFVALFTALLTIAFSANAEPITLFEVNTDGYKRFRIPAIITAQNGDLLAFCEARMGNDASEIDLVSKRSTDGGKTWGTLQVVQESDDFIKFYDNKTKPITVGNPTPVVDLLDPENPGRIWLPFNIENDRVFVTYSDDHGKTWAPHREITSDVKLPKWGWYANGPCHAIQLQLGEKRGRLVIPADHRVSENGADNGPTGAQIFFSDDHGKSWKLGFIDATYDDGINANETTIIELNDGSIYINSRDQGGKASSRTRAEAISRDGGETLVKTLVASPDILDPPIVQCSVLRVSKNLILFSGPDTDGPSGKGRSDLQIRFSRDEAKTWTDGPRLHKGPAGYSDMTLIQPGKIGVLFECGDKKDASQRIDFTILDEASIAK